MSPRGSHQCLTDGPFYKQWLNEDGGLNFNACVLDISALGYHISSLESVVEALSEA